MSPEILLRRVEVELSRHRYSFRNEKELHDGIAQVLRTASIHYTHEWPVDENNRLDFFVGGSVAMEVKIAGSAGDALRQCERYIHLPIVAAVVLATTREWRITRRLSIAGKPVLVLPLQRASF